MRLLLTGASGFFGRNLQDRIRRDRDGGQPNDGTDGAIEVHTTTRKPGDASREGHVHHLDLMDHHSIGTLIESVGPTHLCHLAWLGPEHRDRYRSPDNHRWADASRVLFEAFRDGGGERLVHLGSCIEYGNRAPGVRVETQPLDPDTAYGEAKAALAETVTDLVGDGLSAAVARPFFCYGPHEQEERLVPSLILALADGRTIDLTEGRQVRDFLDVRDIVAALLTLLRTPAATGAFNIGAGTGVTVRSIAEHLGSIAGRPELLNFGGRPEGADSAPEIVADIGRITAFTDWEPSITLEQGLEHATGWWLTSRGGAPLS
ncbi:MAG: NAD(P)-dependent oxidoreductase [Actinomycetota bacterium]